MKPHKAVFRVVNRSAAGRSRLIYKYTCELVDGPYKGSILWMYRAPDVNELEVGNTYAGIVRNQTYGNSVFATLDIERRI